MEFIRKIIDSDELASFFDLPETLKHTKVEILILPFTEGDGFNIQESRGMKLKPPGALEKYKNLSLIEKEKDAWAIAVKEKYEDN